LSNGFGHGGNSTALAVPYPGPLSHRSILPIYSRFGPGEARPLLLAGPECE
jgi:hypothetical protein